MLAFSCIKIGVQVSGFGIYGGYLKLHLTNAEVGMWKDGVAALCLSNFYKIDRIHSL